MLPYDGDDPLAAERVYLPQALFRELWLKTHPEQRRPAKAPVDGLVAEALYSVDVTAEAVAAKPNGRVATSCARAVRAVRIPRHACLVAAAARSGGD